MEEFKLVGSQFVEHHAMLKKGFPFEYQMMHYFGALVLSDAKSVVSVDRIKELKDHLKHKTSVFSSFRGMNSLMFSLTLAVENQGEAVFERTLEVYDILKTNNFKSSIQLPMAALIIARAYPSGTIDTIAQRMRSFYDGMKDNHFWLTGHDDYVYAALLATSKLPVDGALVEMENFYKDLSQGGFSKCNGLQSLTHVLTLGELPYKVRYERAVAVNEHLIRLGYRLNTYQMPFIGVLSLIGESTEEILALADEAIGLEQWLKGHKGFGSLSVDRKNRFCLAASLLVSREIGKSTTNEAVLASSIQALIIAQQVAMMAAITASSAAASTAGGS